MRFSGGLVAAALVVTLLGGALAGCGDDEGDRRLDALKADPMATRAFDGLDEVDTSESTSGDSAVTGKEHPAELRRVFAVTSGSDGVQVLHDAAAAEGWTVKGEVRPSGFLATKTLEDLPATLTVAADPGDGRLSMTLQA